MACHDEGIAGLYDAVDGQAIDPARFGNCMDAIDRPPAGSGNWPIQMAGALYISNPARSQGRELFPWLRGENGWGHNGRESGSLIYEQWNVATALALLWRARQRNDAEMVAAASAYLRTQWAKMALAATPELPGKIEFHSGDRPPARRARIDSSRYRGPFVHLVGNRMVTDPDEGNVYTGGWVEQHALLPAFAWALDWPGRNRINDWGQNEGTLLLWVIARISGATGLEKSLPAEVFGLSEAERQLLRALVEQPQDRERATKVLPLFQPFRMLDGVTLTYRRFVSGEILTVLSSTSNANKPGCVVAGMRQGRSFWISPSDFRPVGARTAFAELFLDRVEYWSDDFPQRQKIDLPDWGPVAWEARWSAQGIALIGAASPGPEPEPTPLPPPPVPPQPPLPTPPTEKSLLFQTIDRELGRLLELAGAKERELIEPCRAALAAIAQLPAPDEARKIAKAGAQLIYRAL